MLVLLDVINSRSAIVAHMVSNMMKQYLHSKNRKGNWLRLPFLTMKTIVRPSQSTEEKAGEVVMDGVFCKRCMDWIYASYSIV